MNESLAVDPSILAGSTAKLRCVSLNQGGSTAKVIKPDMLQQDGIICRSRRTTKTLRSALTEEMPGILRKGSLCPLHHWLIYGCQPIKI
jgi:hypothetical protein